MKKLVVLLLIVAACSPAYSQKKEGWQSLFDGKSLTGWKIFKDRKNNTWEAKDGAIHCKPINEKVKGDGDERSDLMTVGEFESFEFVFDWKISPKGNSGVIYRATEEFEQPYYSGPEYQVLDDAGYSPKPTDKQLTGCNYDMHVTGPKDLKPVGEWNTSKIVVNGNHVEHWLNGKKIVEYELNSDDWKTRKENSKWKSAPGYGMAKKGHIDLQDHGHEVWYKNLKIREL